MTCGQCKWLGFKNASTGSCTCDQVVFKSTPTMMGLRNKFYETISAKLSIHLWFVCWFVYTSDHVLDAILRVYIAGDQVCYLLNLCPHSYFTFLLTFYWQLPAFCLFFPMARSKVSTTRTKGKKSTVSSKKSDHPPWIQMIQAS